MFQLQLQLQLHGAGSVIVPPSEGPFPAAKGKGVADTIGEFLGEFLA